MMIRRLASLGLALAMVMSVALALDGCAKQKPVALAGVASTQSAYVVGTLCSGGFECKWAPAATALDVTRHKLLVLVRKGKINKDAAQEIQRMLDNAHVQLQDSLSACAVDRSGNCTKDSEKAEAALRQATVSLGAATEALAPAPGTSGQVVLTGVSAP